MLFSVAVQFIDRVDDCWLPQLHCAIVLVCRREQQLCTFQQRDRVLLLRSHFADRHLLEATVAVHARDKQEAFLAAILATSTFSSTRVSATPVPIYVCLTCLIFCICIRTAENILWLNWSSVETYTGVQ